MTDKIAAWAAIPGAIQQATAAVQPYTPGQYAPGQYPTSQYSPGQTWPPQRNLSWKLRRKLIIEHTNYLADADLAANNAVRPRSYYNNVSRLWAQSILQQANIPWTANRRVIHAAVRQLLNSTQAQRSPYSKALGVGVSTATVAPYQQTTVTPYGAPPAASYPVMSSPQYGSPGGTPYGYVPGSDSQDDDYDPGDSSGGDSYAVRTLLAQYPQGITLEQINQHPKQARLIILSLVRQNRIRIRN
jgi:hypothetical protein